MHERGCKCKFHMIIADVNIELLTLLACSFVILKGKIYDPADIAIVNRFNGVDRNDITDEVIDGLSNIYGVSLAYGFLDEFVGELS